MAGRGQSTNSCGLPTLITKTNQMKRQQPSSLRLLSVRSKSKKLLKEGGPRGSHPLKSEV